MQITENKKNKSDIVHLISGLDFGGAEQVVFDLAVQMQSRGYHVQVISMLDRTQKLSEFRQANVETHILNMGSALYIFKNLRITWELHKALERQQLRVIHAHMRHALVLAILLKCLKADRKIIFTRHNAIEAFTGWQRCFFWLTRYFRQADIIFSPTEKNAFDVRNGQVIPNGISQVKDVVRKKNSPFIFLSVGMFRDQKNYTALPEVALDLVNKGFTDFEIWLCGDGETLDETKSKAISLTVERYFSFLGAHSDTEKFYTRADAYLLPSKWEGMPLSVLEAGMHGLPVILTPVGALPDYFDENQVYFRNINEFAPTMMEVATNYEVARAKAKKMKSALLEMFSLETMVQKHIDIYQNFS